MNHNSDDNRASTATTFTPEVIELRKRCSAFADAGARVFIRNRVGGTTATVVGYIVATTLDHVTIDCLGRAVVMQFARIIEVKEHTRQSSWPANEYRECVALMDQLDDPRADAHGDLVVSMRAKHPMPVVVPVRVLIAESTSLREARRLLRKIVRSLKRDDDAEAKPE